MIEFYIETATPEAKARVLRIAADTGTVITHSVADGDGQHFALTGSWENYEKFLPPVGPIKELAHQYSVEHFAE